MQNLLPENTSAFNIDMINWKEVIDNLFRWFTSGAGTVIGYVTSFFSVIFNFVVGLIFAIYILGGKEKLANQFKRIVSTYTNGKISTKVFYVLKVTDECFHNFIVGQCMEAVILGALCTIGMLILRLPYAVMIGVFVGCTALIPIAGAYIGAIVGVIMIFTVAPVKSIFFIVFIIILQQLENQLIYPKVVGSSIGLPGIWVFAAVMIGGMVPPLAIALATTFFKNRFTESERKSGIVNYVMGLSFITEGAIPFAAADPLRVIPACAVGSAVAGALSMLFNASLRAPHGGIFVIPVIGKPFGFLAAVVIGSLVGMILLALLKKDVKEA